MLFKGELSSPPISQCWEKSVDVGVLSSHFPSNHLVSGAIVPCCGYILPMFPRCIWHKLSCKIGKFLKGCLCTPQEFASLVFRLKVVRKVILSQIVKCVCPVAEDSA